MNNDIVWIQSLHIQSFNLKSGETIIVSLSQRFYASVFHTYFIQSHKIFVKGKQCVVIYFDVVIYIVMVQLSYNLISFEAILYG